MSHKKELDEKLVKDSIGWGEWYANGMLQEANNEREMDLVYRAEMREEVVYLQTLIQAAKQVLGIQ